MKELKVKIEVCIDDKCIPDYFFINLKTVVDYEKYLKDYLEKVTDKIKERVYESRKDIIK